MPYNNFILREFCPRAWTLAAIIFISRLGAMVKLFMAIYLKVTLGLSIEVIGLLLSGYGAGLVAGSYVAGIASDRWPAKGLTQLLMLSGGLLLLALPHLDSATVLAAVLVVSGVFDGGIRTLHQRLILDYCPAEGRDHAQAINRVGINLGMACAGVLGGLVSDWDMRALFYISAGLLMIAAAAFAFASRNWALVMAHADDDATSAVQASPYKDRRYLGFLLGCTLVGLAYEPIYSTLGNYLVEYYRLSPGAIGCQFALNELMVVALQIPITYWTSSWGVRNQLLAGSVLLGIGLVLIPFGAGVAYLSACTALWTLGELLFMPAMGIHVMQQAKGSKSGHYFGLYAMFWSLGTLLSPVLASQIYSRLGGDYLWLICCAMTLAAALMIMLAVQPRTP